MMKKTNYILTALLAIGLVACGGNKNNEEESADTMQIEEMTFETELNPEDAETESPEASEATPEIAMPETPTTDATEETAKEEKAKSKAGSENWDALIKSYEEIVDKYIALAKKAKNGDISSVTEAASIAAKANDLYSKLDAAEGDLTPAQAAKLAKIYAKMASAAATM